MVRERQLSERKEPARAGSPPYVGFDVKAAGLLRWLCKSYLRPACLRAPSEGKKRHLRSTKDSFPRDVNSAAGPGAVPQHHAGLPGATRLPAAAAGGVAGPAWALWQPGAARGAGPRCAAGGKGARTRRGCFLIVMFGQSIICALHRGKRRHSVCAKPRWGCALHDALPSACAPCFALCRDV